MAAIEEIGLAVLRQRASDVVRRVEAGQEFLVTVSGRPAARLVGLDKKTWVPAADVVEMLAGLPTWGTRDRGDDVIDDDVRDPWDDAP